MSLVDKVTTATSNFMTLIVKIVLLELVFALSAKAEDKMQYFVHLSYISTLQLINGISSDPQKLFIYFKSTATVAFSDFPLLHQFYCFLIMWP